MNEPSGDPPQPAESNRRDFLTGRSAARAVEHLADALPGQLGGPPALNPSAKSYLLQVSRQAMACDFQVLLNAQPDQPEVDAAIAALDVVEEVEQQLSAFRESSEIGRINRRAGREPVVVAENVFGLLEECCRLCRDTQGAFDITASPLWRLWGFHRRAGHFPGAEQVELVRQCVGSQWLNCQAADHSVSFAREGMEINLGAIGKGYALDLAAARLDQAGLSQFLIHGGGSSIVARGSRDPAGEAGWRIGIEHPLRAGQRIAEVRLVDRALGTSGSAKQYFYHQGRRLSHILDPRTGWPAQGILGATVLARSAAMADALSTAFFVMSVEQTRAYCERHPEISALLVIPGEREGQIELVTANLHPQEWIDQRTT